MAKKKSKAGNYSAGNFIFLLLCALSVLSLFLPYISGGEVQIPAAYLNGSGGKIGTIFGIMFVILKAVPALVSFIVQLVPADVIKKYVATFCISLYLLAGEVISFVILSQRYAGSAGFGFYVGVICAAAAAALCILFTKTNKAPKKHKDMVWYRGFNKIIVLIGLPLCTAATVAIALFAGLVFRFPFMTALGIMCIWGCLFICSIISVFTLFEKYKMGILYYLVAFLNALGIVALCWSDSISLMIFSVIFASCMGFFWLSMGEVARKYF